MAEQEYPVLRELETKLKLQWIDTNDYLATQRAIIQVEPELAYLELPRGRKGDKGDAGPAISIQGIITADSQLPASAEVGHAYVNTSTKGLAVWNGSSWFKVDNFAGVDADVQQFSRWLAQLESEARRAANAADRARDSASSAEYWANETIQQVEGDFATRNYVDSILENEYFAIDGAPSLFANPDFKQAPSTAAPAISDNWYSVTSPTREWVSVADAPGGTAHVIRINETNSYVRQLVKGLGEIPGRELIMRVTARAVAANGETRARPRILVDIVGGNVVMDQTLSSVGTEWETREVQFTVPNDVGARDVRFGLATSPNAPIMLGHLELAHVSLIDPSRDLSSVIAKHAGSAAGSAAHWQSGASYKAGDTIITPMGHTLACVEAHTSRERMTDDLPKWAPVGAPPNEPILAARSRLGHGQTIGIGSRIAVSLRFDDWHLDMRDTVIPLLNERGLPSGLASISDLNGQPWISGITEDDIRAWNRAGTEICSHGHDHKDPSPHDLTGMGGLYDQIVNSKKTIESWNVHCRGWMHPGATPLISDVIPYGTGFSDWQSMEGYAGWLIRNTYPVSLSYVYGAAASQLPRSAMHGGSHTTISDGMAFSAVMGGLERALERGRSIAFMIHAGNLGKPGNMSVAEFTQVLDWLVEKRAAGLVEVITPTGMVFADHSTHRDEAIRNGDFSRGEAEWSNLSSGRTVQSGEGYKGAGFVSITQSSSGLITQSISQLKSRAWDGHTFMFEGYARAQSATTTARVTIAGGDLSLDKTFENIGTEWTPIYVPFTIPPGVPDIQVGVGHAAGENIDWDCVSIRPI